MLSVVEILRDQNVWTPTSSGSCLILIQNVSHIPHSWDIYMLYCMCSQVFPEEMPYDSTQHCPWESSVGSLVCQQPHLCCSQRVSLLGSDCSECYHTIIVVLLIHDFSQNHVLKGFQLLGSSGCQKLYGGLWLNWRDYHFALRLCSIWKWSKSCHLCI